MWISAFSFAILTKCTLFIFSQTFSFRTWDGDCFKSGHVSSQKYWPEPIGWIGFICWSSLVTWGMLFFKLVNFPFLLVYRWNIFGAMQTEKYHAYPCSTIISPPKLAILQHTCTQLSGFINPTHICLVVIFWVVFLNNCWYFFFAGLHLQFCL